MILGHDDLRRLHRRKIGPKHVIGGRASIRHRHGQHQGRAGVIVPDLGRIDPVPMAPLALFQQEVDAGAAGAPSAARLHPSLAIMPALGMRREVQLGDDLVRGQRVLSTIVLYNF